MNTKWTLVNLLVASSLAVSSVEAQDVPISWPAREPLDVLSDMTAGLCEDTPILWRNLNFTCPERAICADVFLTTREFEDGTQCQERRITHNCLCPGGSVCPVENPSHLLYASAKQRQYTCRNICHLPFCGNVKSTAAVSQTTLQNAANFGGRTYTRMDCRCPRHHIPFGNHRTVQAAPRRFNIKQSTEYVCSTTEIEDLISDPCEV